ncbi:molecular chaperone [Enterobacter kobei]|uniref:fimbrial biogenesis chaperone n=1 Tax=Enterobacter kobei TaxID=208224 RepID=UPI002FCEBFA1
MKTYTKIFKMALIMLAFSSESYAAIALDRTRAIINEGDKSISLTIENKNEKLPYLAQAWLEDVDGKKVASPFTILPPIQRLEANSTSQLKIQALPAVSLLPSDRESVYYFNIREIPPKSKKANVLQIALQSKIKLFYRPKSIIVTKSDLDNPWQNSVTVSLVDGKYKVNNPSPYHLTIAKLYKDENAKSPFDIEPLMVSPKSSAFIKVNSNVIGNTFYLSYINDYGGKPLLKFTCAGTICSGEPVKKGKGK